ncbi:hypothetical protein EMGBS15_02300 [Filimonas sp.]|nr:hypothetical protein EMGBS15_02300 [Filimonas sp.]
MEKSSIFFTKDDSEIPFDLFSAGFFLISRYEEYLPYAPDRYQRFPEKNSLAFKHDFLSIPLVDLWVMEMKKVIQSKTSSILFPEKKMTCIPTYDIDIPYSYKGKGWFRNAGGLLRDLFSGKLSSVNERINVLKGNQDDPYDSFDFLDSLHKKYALSPIYFFLLSKGGPLDKNISPAHPLMQSLIERTLKKYAVGIHPSYQSNDDMNALRQEISLLDTSKSRQHYIRFELPDTFRHLIELGIKEDYSMGYGSTNGFRASTSHRHRWFDLEKNEVSSLNLFPFCFMECNSFFEQQFSVDEAFQEMVHYADIVEAVGGNFISIWHNFSLGTDPIWEGWKEMYAMFWERKFSE